MTRSASDRNVISKIEEWFAQAGGEGDFWRCELTDPFTVVGPEDLGREQTFVFAPKAYLVLEAKREHREFDGIGLLSRSGLPQAKDVEWVRRLLAGCRLAFLGDLDPVDLMTFAWWRASLGTEQVEYLGINDRYLESLRAEIPHNYTVPVSTCETRAMSVLATVCPDYRNLVGPNGSAILADGRKIELEAVATTLGPPGRLLTPLLGTHGA